MAHSTENPCPNCGAQSYRWGVLDSGSGVWFKEDGRSYLFRSGKSLKARLCNQCGNVQIFTREAAEGSWAGGAMDEKPKRQG
jgi:predicted RNA-binding Zn-ribbon protein involved in translation (DUF1610 family)